MKVITQKIVDPHAPEADSLRVFVNLRQGPDRVIATMLCRVWSPRTYMESVTASRIVYGWQKFGPTINTTLIGSSWDTISYGQNDELTLRDALNKRLLTAHHSGAIDLPFKVFSFRTTAAALRFMGKYHEKNWGEACASLAT